jgi:lysozyme
MRNIIRRILREQTENNRQDVSSLRASQGFWDWLRWHEGSLTEKGQPVLKSYKDTAGVWTIGYGHTGSEAKQGNVIDAETANNLFKKDVNEAAACVKRFLKEWKEQNVEGQYLKTNEYEALISLVFNSGCEGVRTSPFIQKIKYGKYDEGAEMIKSYKSGGLEKRRNAEYELFKNDTYVKD